MAKFLAFIALFSILCAEIIEIDHMDQILPHVDETTWVLFDIDDTLLESELQVGRAKWFFYEVEKEMAQGLDYESAVLACYPEWIRMQEICPIRSPEPEIPAIVHLVQQSAGATFGLTARHPPICATTLKQLAYLGIDFTFSAPFCPPIETKAATHWEGGVLFLSDFNRKGEVFRKWLEISPIRPSKIILIDDGKHHLINMEKQMGAIGIPCTCFHYIKTTQRPFDPDLAEKEYSELSSIKESHDL
jgi:FMN phosphatase YigB (HAD superfamily)